MASRVARDPAEMKEIVLRILDENRTMTVATLRPDGWPQATIVGYVHDGLTLYFAVSAASQKIHNLRRDPRTSIAIGHPMEGRSVRGLSMAAHASEVVDWHEIDRLNGVIRTHYPEVDVFAPRDSHAAVVRAVPVVLSVVDDPDGLRQPLLLEVSKDGELTPLDGAV